MGGIPAAIYKTRLRFVLSQCLLIIFHCYKRRPYFVLSYLSPFQDFYMLDKLFGWSKKKPEIPEPGIHFGRYSDNNKPVHKVDRWTDADNLFKEKKYQESFDAFFDYLKD